MITINTVRRVVYVNGHSHYLSRAGCNALFAWLLDNARLAWGFDDAGEYVFRLEVGNESARP